MIKSLRIRNLATIEDLELRLDEGFAILTGETGAGKSIIIDAIKLILGEKGSADLIRTGKKESHIEGIFDTSNGHAAIEEIPPGEGTEILIQRQLSEKGPGKAYLNGVLVPLRELRKLGPHLIDIYGQNDHIFLLHLENHLRYLDAFLDNPELISHVHRSSRELRKLIVEKSALESAEKEREQRLDFLAYQIREIESARLKPGEDEELLREREILRNAEKIAILVDKALDLAYEHEASVLPLIAKCRTVIEELGTYDPSFSDFTSGLEEATIFFQDMADSLIRFRDRRAEAPENLEELEERLSVLEKLKRKYGNSIEAILERLEAFRRELTGLATNRDRLLELDNLIEKEFITYKDFAMKLSRLRKEKSRELGKLIENEISLLGMKKAKFIIQTSVVTPSLDDVHTIREQGTDDVEFVISPNPGEELRPLRKIASGGELSRIMLALKSVGRDEELAKTLIFDEIDSGIGGKTAEFIAQKLKKLARFHQVLCVTHLPQIASSAAHHFRVDKKIEKARTFTKIQKLTREERAMEIARLIAGSRVTESSLKTAREMLEHHLERKSSPHAKG